MRILVTFALDAEFGPWRKLRAFHQRECGDIECYSSKLDQHEVAVLLTGIGCRKAWVQATRVIWASQIDVCISSGLAGALRPEHRIGEILAPQSVLASKQDRAISCDQTLVDSAVAAGAKRVSTFYTADRVITRAAEKKNLGALADAVEMESAGVLVECAAFGARIMAVRAISDLWDEDLPLDFNGIATQEGDVSIGKILRKVAGSPSSIPSLVRFGQRSQRAAESLAGFLERFIGTIAAATSAVPPQEVAR